MQSLTKMLKLYLLFAGASYESSILFVILRHFLQWIKSTLRIVTDSWSFLQVIDTHEIYKGQAKCRCQAKKNFRTTYQFFGLKIQIDS